MDKHRIAVIAGDGIERTLEEGPRTPDMGGRASTEDVGKAVAAAV